MRKYGGADESVEKQHCDSHLEKKGKTRPCTSSTSQGVAVVPEPQMEVSTSHYPPPRPPCSTPRTGVAYFIPAKVHVDTVLITAGTGEILENFLEETYSAVFRAFSGGAVHQQSAILRNR